MKLFRVLEAGIRAMYNEAVKPHSYYKGETFENYVRKYIFKRKDYGLIYKTADYNYNKRDFLEASMYPDYLLKSLRTKQEFYVEAKFRSYSYKDKINCCKSFDQLNRYKQIGKSKPTFLILGFSGKPNKPERLFFIPIEDIKYPDMYESVLRNYEIKPKKPAFVEQYL